MARLIMSHPKLIAWERKLTEVLAGIDHDLEEEYGHAFPLHPARARHGTTTSPADSGLFRIQSSFSAGFGSHIGRGYLVKVHLVTLSKVPTDVRQAAQDLVAEKLRERLPAAFPGKHLRVDRDGLVYKIHGDLSLGRV